MGSASQGLSWALNLYQKWGNICLENVVAQNQCRFIDELGEQFKVVLNEIASDWLSRSDASIDGPVSDLSLEHDVITKICNKTRVGLEEHHLNVKLPQCVELFSCASSLEDHDLSENIRGDLRHRKENLVPKVAEVTSDFSDDTIKKCKDVSDLVTSLADCTSALPSPDEGLASEPQQYEVTKLSDTIATELSISLSQSLQKEHGQEIEVNILEDSMQLSANDSSDEFNKGKLHNMLDAIHSTSDFSEEFEDVKFDDCRDYTNEHDVALATKQACRRKFYKKKISYMFGSKPKSSNDNEQAGEKCSYIDTVIQDRPEIPASSASAVVLHTKMSSTLESYESDWELL